jgi:small subunit ribosomal protein S20
VAIAKIAVLMASRRRGGGGGEDGGGARVDSPASALSRDTEGAIVRAVATVARGVLVMANIHSQKKRIVRAERERLENRRYTSAVKTYFRRLERAVADGEEAVAETEHRTLVQTIDKAVKNGALHRNNGARKKSRAARLRRGV